MNIYHDLTRDILAGKKKFAVLLDPDKYDAGSVASVTARAKEAGIDYFLVGGSLVVQDNLAALVSYISENTSIPVILFPGNNLQLTDRADAILLLSLISGRNPDLLIGRHVITAPYLHASGLEIIPTGYMLVESGRTTTVMYMSDTTPIPGHKPEIAACTAMAGEMLGMKLIYLDAGSGASHPVPADMIAAVKKSVEIPVIVGGGITSPGMVRAAYQAGADLVVVGNAIERDADLIVAMAAERVNR